MADTSRADVLTYLENANMMEISELVGEIEEKFGVRNQGPLKCTDKQRYDVFVCVKLL